MTVTVLDVARRELAVHDMEKQRQRRERRERVHRLTAVGYTADQVGHELGITRRSVERHKASPPVPGPPPLPDARRVSAGRCAELEQTAALAVELVGSLRDENPHVCWSALSRLDRRQLQELAVVALAAIPVDATLAELFGWVLDLPCASGEPL